MARKNDKYTVKKFNKISIGLSSPEAILCNVVIQSGGKSYTEHNKRVDVGLILFPDAQEVPETSNQWSVGIDFGTTNSCVYFKENKECLMFCAAVGQTQSR